MRFFIDLDGEAPDATGQDFRSLDEARNAAIAQLGSHLQGHPDFAYAQHWRVDVRDSEGRLALHVIVATVVAPEPINFASFEEWGRS